MRGETNAECAVLVLGSVQFLLGLFGVDSCVEFDEAETALRVQEAFTCFAEFLE